MRRLFLVAGAAGLFAAGVWFGRDASVADAAEHPRVPAAELSVTLASKGPRGSERVPAQRPALPPSTVASFEGVHRARRFDELSEDLADADPKVRRAAMREAVHAAGTDSRVFIEGSRDSDLEVGIVSTIALGRLYAEGHIDATELMEIATDRSLDERVRITALNGVGVVPSMQATDLLLELLTRGAVEERASAAILLVHQEPERAIPALIGALGDSDPLVQANALEALRSRSRGRDFGTDAAAWQAWWASRSR